MQYRRTATQRLWSRWLSAWRVRRRQGAPRARIAVTLLEARDCPTTYTVDFGSTPISIHAGQPGNKVSFEVSFSTTDPDDFTEAEFLHVTSNSGSFADMTFPPIYGQTPVPQKVTFTATQTIEGLNAYIDGADGDESATITTFGTVIPEKIQPLANGDLKVFYNVTDKLPDGDPIPIGVYWATGPKGTDALAVSAGDAHGAASSVDDALDSYDVDANTQPGEHSFTVKADKLLTAPNEATYMLIVADPDKNLSDQSDEASVLPLQEHDPATLTTAQWSKLLSAAGGYATQLAQTMHDFNIASLEQRAMYLAQLNTESAGLAHWEEGWDKKPHSLRTDRPHPYTATSKQDYFNYWYHNVNGNGNYASNDGYNFHGRGPIQITGRDTYQSFADYASAHLGVTDVMTHPEKLADKSQPLLGLQSSGWFWDQYKGLNGVTDDYAGKTTNEFAKRATKLVNGGTSQGSPTFLGERTRNYQRIRLALLDPNL